MPWVFSTTDRSVHSKEDFLCRSKCQINAVLIAYHQDSGMKETLRSNQSPMYFWGEPLGYRFKNEDFW